MEKMPLAVAGHVQKVWKILLRTTMIKIEVMLKLNK